MPLCGCFDTDVRPPPDVVFAVFDPAALPPRIPLPNDLTMLPAPAHGWSDDHVRVVLEHEIAHVARRDWIAQLAVEALKAIYWFNLVGKNTYTALENIREIRNHCAHRAGPIEMTDTALTLHVRGLEQGVERVDQLLLFRSIHVDPLSGRQSRH